MAEYEIHTIGEAKPWPKDSPTVFYIDVGVVGHDKLVSVGKKSPDALKVGDKITGEIIPTEYNTDKFKAEYVGGYNGPKKSGFSPAERAKSADGMRQGMCFNNAANYVTAKADKLPPFEWASAVFEYAQVLYSKGDLKPATEPEEKPQEEAKPSPLDLLKGN